MIEPEEGVVEAIIWWIGELNVASSLWILRFLKLERVPTPWLETGKASLPCDWLESVKSALSFCWFRVYPKIPVHAMKKIHMIFVCRISTAKAPTFRYMNTLLTFQLEKKHGQIQYLIIK